MTPSTFSQSGPGGLVDRRLLSRAAVTRRYLARAVAIGLASSACVVVQAVLVATVIERALLHHASLAEVTPQLAGLTGAFAARAALVWAGELAAQRTSIAVTSALRTQMLHHALALGPSWLAGERPGELSLSATRGTDALDLYFGRYLPVAVIAGIAPLGLLAWIASADWPSVLVLLGLVALVPVSMVFFGRESTKRMRRQWRRLSSLSARFLDLVQGLPTLRAFGRAPHGRREVREATEGLRHAMTGTLKVAFLSALAMELLSGLGVGLVAMVLGLRLLGGTVSLSTALAVLLVAPEVFLPLRRAGAEFHASAEGQAAAERILDVLDLPLAEGLTEGMEKTAPVPAPNPAAARIELRHATVHYSERGHPALGPLDLTIEPGEHLAVVGPSGAGKSTLLAVLLGFTRVDSGSLVVGGIDLASCDLVQWRRSVTWVPQHPHVFSGTVADNLRVACPDAGDRDLAWALQVAGLESFVGQLPAGSATPIGEGGLGISAGERQRLAIARAVLRDVPLVLLDEPAAHLDAEREEEVRRGLEAWLAPRTVVVAAHRTDLVGRVDRVVQLFGTNLAPLTTDEPPLAHGAAAGRTG